MCSDWAPPSTAASACSATRATLFSGCWAVADTPAVCVCVRSRIDSGFVAPNRSFMTVAQIRRAARSLAISSKKSLWMSKKNDSRGAKRVDVAARARRRPRRSARPSASVKASSCTAVEPASRMW